MRPAKKTSFSLKFVQRKFIKSKTLRRNRKIFDIDSIDQFQNYQQRNRRTPFTTHITSDIQQKISESFLNSTTINSYKLQSQIQKHKQKFNYCNTLPQTRQIHFISSNINHNHSHNHNLNTNQSEEQFNDHSMMLKDQEEMREGEKNLGKAICMKKMISRQHRENVGYRRNHNQRRFNNFHLNHHDQSKVRSFDKYLSRESLEKLRAQTVPDSNPEVPIIYEKVAYPSNTFRVSWDYKKNRQPRGPIVSRPVKDHSINLNEIGLQRIDVGLAATQSNWNKTLTNFQSLSIKQQRSQMQRSLYPPNMNFRQKKYKPQNRSKQMKIKQKKMYPEFERWQLCDLKFFGIRKWKRGGSVRLDNQ